MMFRKYRKQYLDDEFPEGYELPLPEHRGGPAKK